MDRIYFPIIILASVFISCNQSNRLVIGSNNGVPSGSGKCFAKCLSSDQKEMRKITYNKYTGKDDKIRYKYVQDQLIELAPAMERWEKRQTSGCPPSTPPEDCMVWCKTQLPASELLLEDVLLDTTITKEFELVEKSAWVVVNPGGSLEWVEVICEGSITSNLINQLSQSLVSKGYLDVEASIHNNITPVFKDALINFQKDHGLFYGSLTVESTQLLLLENSF